MCWCWRCWSWVSWSHELMAPFEVVVMMSSMLLPVLVDQPFVPWLAELSVA